MIFFFINLKRNFGNVLCLVMLNAIMRFLDERCEIELVFNLEHFVNFDKFLTALFKNSGNAIVNFVSLKKELLS